MMTNHVLRMSLLMVVAGLVSVADTGRCCAQSSTRQSTPDPYFQPAKVSVAERYNTSDPYVPPQFGSQQQGGQFGASPQSTATSESVNWAPPNTATTVSPRQSVPMPGNFSPVANAATQSSTGVGVGASGWNPPTTPVKTGTLSLNTQRSTSVQPDTGFQPSRNSSITRNANQRKLGATSGLQPALVPAVQPAARSIIREGQHGATANPLASGSATMANRPTQFMNNPFVAGGSGATASSAPIAKNKLALGKPMAETPRLNSAKKSGFGSSFKSIPTPSTSGIGSPKPEMFTSAATAKPISKPSQKAFGSQQFGGQQDRSAATEIPSTGSSSSVRVASLSRDLNQPTSPNVERENVESFELGRVLAIVGGEPVFVGDIMFEANQMIEQRAAGAPESDKVKLRQELVKRLLPKYVNEKMLYVSTLQGIPDGVEIESIIEQAAGQFDELELPKMIESSGVKNVAEFEANLRAQGSSVQTLRRSWAKTQIVRSFLGQQLNVNATVTHRELLDEYRAHLADYERKAKSKWEQIMIRFDKVSSRDEAQKMAKEVLDQVVYGGNFEAVAKKVSHGFRANEGGQHDWTTKGSLVLKEIDNAIFTLPIGKVSGIIESRDGLHILRVIDRTQAGHEPFLEAQVEIKKQLLNKKRDDAFNKHLEKLKDQIPVEYYTAS